MINGVDILSLFPQLVSVWLKLLHKDVHGYWHHVFPTSALQEKTGIYKWQVKEYAAVHSKESLKYKFPMWKFTLIKFFLFCLFLASLAGRRSFRRRYYLNKCNTLGFHKGTYGQSIVWLTPTGLDQKETIGFLFALLAVPDSFKPIPCQMQRLHATLAAS